MMAGDNDKHTIWAFCSLYVNNYLSAADSRSLQLQPRLPRDRRRLSTQLLTRSVYDIREIASFLHGTFYSLYWERFWSGIISRKVRMMHHNYPLHVNRIQKTYGARMIRLLGSSSCEDLPPFRCKQPLKH